MARTFILHALCVWLAFACAACGASGDPSRDAQFADADGATGDAGTTPDSSGSDAAEPDATTDGGEADAAEPDATTDGGEADAAEPDATTDGGEADAAADVSTDAGESDTETPDADAPDVGEPDVTEDTGEPDATADTGDLDVTEDTGDPDVSPDAGEPDVTEDTGDPDVTGDTGDPDVSPDAGEPDATGDTGSPDTAPSTGSVRICMFPTAGIPGESYPSVVANGSWNDWRGWGVALEGPNEAGQYCGTLEDLDVGTYEFVFAGTGPGDEWSGWGIVGRPPAGTECDASPLDDDYTFGFEIVAGEQTEVCHSWDACSCEVLPTCDERPGREVPVVVDGRNLVVAGEPLHIKGVSWAPTPVGGGPGFGPYWDTFIEEDVALMAAAGINAVKTYGSILDVEILDQLWAAGIYVMPTVFYGGANTIEGALADACEVKDHPAILGWVIGNEWNYTGLDRGLPEPEAAAAVQEVAEALQAFDSTRPIMTVYGGMPSPERIDSLSAIDVWGLNIYTGPSFWGLFSDWQARSDAPMFLAEYGADAFDSRVDAENEALQASIVLSLTEEIRVNTSINGEGVCFGGTLFEWSDEWWKYSGGAWDEHDTAASWENGAYEDPSIQEEWWGIVRVDRTTRDAYDAYASVPMPDSRPTRGSVEICATGSEGDFPRDGYELIVANGSWNGWAGFGVQLEDPDGDGRFCGRVEGLWPGTYEYVLALTGTEDDFSGWGPQAAAPVGSECDMFPDDEFGNWGFTIVAGETASVCNGWNVCGCAE